MGNLGFEDRGGCCGFGCLGGTFGDGLGGLAGGQGSRGQANLCWYRYVGSRASKLVTLFDVLPHIFDDLGSLGEVPLCTLYVFYGGEVPLCTLFVFYVAM